MTFSQMEELIHLVNAELKELRCLLIHSEDVKQFAEMGTIKVKLSMHGEEIESFLTGHAVKFKRVNDGLELILTPQRVWQVAGAWQQYRHERADKADPHKLQKSILTFCEALEADRGFYDGWKVNIAMAFYDEFVNSNEPQHFGVDKKWLHKVCNAAAERFLKVLLPPRNGQAKPFPGANVQTMAGTSPYCGPQSEGKLPGQPSKPGSHQEVPIHGPQGEPSRTGGDIATGDWLYHGTKYWIIPDNEFVVGHYYTGQIHALYSGDGIFLYNGREVRMARGSKAETR